MGVCNKAKQWGRYICHQLLNPRLGQSRYILQLQGFLLSRGIRPARVDCCIIIIMICCTIIDPDKNHTVASSAQRERERLDQPELIAVQWDKSLKAPPLSSKLRQKIGSKLSCGLVQWTVSQWEARARRLDVYIVPCRGLLLDVYIVPCRGLLLDVYIVPCRGSLLDVYCTCRGVLLYVYIVPCRGLLLDLYCTCRGVLGGNPHEWHSMVPLLAPCLPLVKP